MTKQELYIYQWLRWTRHFNPLLYHAVIIAVSILLGFVMWLVSVVFLTF